MARSLKAQLERDASDVFFNLKDFAEEIVYVTQGRRITGVIGTPINATASVEIMGQFSTAMHETRWDVLRSTLPQGFEPMEGDIIIRRLSSGEEEQYEVMPMDLVESAVRKHITATSYYLETKRVY